MKFNIGDKVVSLGKNHERNSRWYPKAGAVGTIVSINERNSQPYKVQFKKGSTSLNDCWWQYADDIAPYAPASKILITSDGKTTLARLYEGDKVTRSAEAKCSPTDTYDFATGANLAYDRLMRSTQASVEPQDKPKFKAGDKARVMANTCNHGANVGDIVTLDNPYIPCDNRNAPAWTVKEESDIPYVYISERDLEPYTEPAKADNSVFSWDDFKAGKIAVHCDTEEKAKAFLRECKEKLPRESHNWESRENHWDVNESQTTYSIQDEQLLYADMKSDRDEGLTIIDYPFSPAEPAKAPEAPVKLYCVKDYEPGHWCTKGKIYEIDAKGGITHDDGWIEQDFLPFMRHGGCIYGEETEWAKYLVPLVSRPAKAGEWVLPLADCPFGRYKKNQLLKVTKDLSNKPDSVFYNRGVVYEHPDCNAYVIRNEEYLVLDGYDGRYEPAEPKYYSGKVVCVWSNLANQHAHTVGKIYEFKDGIVNNNQVASYNYGNPAKTKDEALTRECVHFIEYKGEAT